MARDPIARSNRRELYMPARAVRNPQVRGLLPGEGRVRTVTAGAATSLLPAPGEEGGSHRTAHRCAAGRSGASIRHARDRTVLGAAQRVQPQESAWAARAGVR